LKSDDVIYDPYWCNGLSKQNWQELGFEIIHEPVDFFDELTVPFEKATILITK